LLEEQGIDIELVEYLRYPPTADELRSILKKLDMTAAAIVRQGESAFRDSGLAIDSSEDELITLMASEPIVIERPIVIIAERARIGRPPENVLELIE